MKYVCVDAGFLIGLCDERDQHHGTAVTRFSELFDAAASRMVIPWPILFEVVSTKMVKNHNGMLRLERNWKYLRGRNQIDLVSDEPYRATVLQDCFNEFQRSLGSQRTFSAVDRVIRNILADRAMSIDAFVTFNTGDFADVCKRFNRELVSY
jgi:hypothetical protein